MVRVNCQNGDGGGSWVGDFQQKKNLNSQWIVGPHGVCKPLCWDDVVGPLLIEAVICESCRVHIFETGLEGNNANGVRGSASKTSSDLDGPAAPAIRNANRGDSREPIRVNRFAENKKKLLLS